MNWTASSGTVEHSMHQTPVTVLRASELLTFNCHKKQKENEFDSHVPDRQVDANSVVRTYHPPTFAVGVEQVLYGQCTRLSLSGLRETRDNIVRIIIQENINH